VSAISTMPNAAFISCLVFVERAGGLIFMV
jgi:hypothetical protein